MTTWENLDDKLEIRFFFNLMCSFDTLMDRVQSFVSIFLNVSI